MFFWKWNSVFIILLSPIPLTLIYAKHLFLTPLIGYAVIWQSVKRQLLQLAIGNLAIHTKGICYLAILTKGIS